MKLNAAEKNALEAVEYLLRETKVKVSSTGLKDDLVMHPDFPSIAAISDALSEWQVPNMATRIHAMQLREIPLPSMVYLNLNGGMFAPLKSVTADTVEWLDTQRGWQKEPIFAFEQKWNGITLLLEPGEKSGEPKYSENISAQFAADFRIPFLIIGTLICLLTIFAFNWNQFQLFGSNFELMLGVKIAGTIVGSLLLWQSLDADNPFLQNICHLSNGTNCNSILQSKSSKITALLSWAEVGFIYFTGGLFALLFALMIPNASILNYLAILTLAAVPYTVYSIWYQRFVAKEWCVLCLLVQVLLWSETAIILIFSNEYNWVWDLRMLPILMLAFLIPILLWVAIKKPLTEAAQLFDVQRELQSVKFNESYIRATLINQPQMPPIFEDMRTASIGNLNAPHVLTIVTNPLCGPCARLHSQINGLVDSHANMQCQFIFLGPPKALGVASVFINSNATETKKVMDSWYHNIYQDPQKWI